MSETEMKNLGYDEAKKRAEAQKSINHCLRHGIGQAVPEPILPTDRQPHHLELLQAIETLKAVRYALESLLREITVRDEEKAPRVVPGTNRSLSWVLSETPGIIREDVNACLSLMQEIRGILF